MSDPPIPTPIFQLYCIGRSFRELLIQHNCFIQKGGFWSNTITSSLQNGDFEAKQSLPQVWDYGSGSEFSSSYGSGSATQKVTVPVLRHWDKNNQKNLCASFFIFKLCQTATLSILNQYSSEFLRYVFLFFSCKGTFFSVRQLKPGLLLLVYFPF